MNNSPGACDFSEWREYTEYANKNSFESVEVKQMGWSMHFFYHKTRAVLVGLVILTASSAWAQVSPPEPAPLLLTEIMVAAPPRYPHDPTAFTQGLLLDADGVMYESTGQPGESSLRRVDWRTGEVLARFDVTRASLEAAGWLDEVITTCDGMTLAEPTLLPEETALLEPTLLAQETALPDGFVRAEPELFAEGLALVDDRLIQLTWQGQCAIVYDRETLMPIEILRYDDDPTLMDEGWGLCDDGESLWMSDGSSTLKRRDRQTFALLQTVAVTYQGQPIDRLNELECVGGSIYANQWQTSYILRIDKSNGVVDGIVIAENLLSPEERTSANVLNGIAYDPTRDLFLITGKDWPWLFETRFGVVALQ